jgi:coenzyme Q-binding protein COQ10
MPIHREHRTLPYKREDIFALVLDIERYPEFLPWCRAVRVYGRQENACHADVSIGYQLLNERYSCRVYAEP